MYEDHIHIYMAPLLALHVKNSNNSSYFHIFILKYDLFIAIKTKS